MLATICLSMALVVPAAVDDWLEPAEREFFEAFGVDAQFRSTDTQRKADLARLPAIAGRAQGLLGRRIEAYVAEGQRIGPTPEEKAQLSRQMNQGVQEMQANMRMGMVGMLLGGDPTDYALDMANKMARKDGNMVEAWKIQRIALERSAEATVSRSQALTQIVDGVRRDGGGALPGSAVAFRLGLAKDQLAVVAEVGPAGLGESVLEVTIHRKPTNGQWAATNAASLGATRAMGVKNVEQASGEGMRLSVAQERMMNLPMLHTVRLVPKLAAGDKGRVSLAIPAAPALRSLDRVEVRLVTAAGSTTVASIPGLDEVRAELARRAPATQAARRGNNTPAQPQRRAAAAGQPQRRAASAPRPVSADEKKAKATLDAAKDLIKLGKPDQAARMLDKVIELAPDSDAARQARILKKSLG